MRSRPTTWLLLSIACFLGAIYFWRLGDARQAKRKPATTTTESVSKPSLRPSSAARKTVTSTSTAPLALLSLPQTTNAAAASAAVTREARLKYRLSNTPLTAGQLARSDSAILLENALIDTGRPLDFSIPDSLRAQGDPGAYIVQAHGPVDDAFRAALKAAGAEIVSYIPNNAYLVRASASVARQMSASSQSVLPFEPYYKLSPGLLWLVMRQEPLPQAGALNVVAFADTREATLAALAQMGVKVTGEHRSPFGPVFSVQAGDGQVTAIAGLAGVQTLELASKRVVANDLSRARVRVALDSTATNNHLGLTGTNVLVQLNDTGVDAAHPDLTNRVTGLFLYDADGHGTHVAGIIAGDGTMSITVTNVPGSTLTGGTNNNAASTNQFRGMAPQARLYAQPLFLSDFELQEAAARTNALISNNSWNYANNDYNIAAASYDAAVRDALPEVTGSQPVLFVFSAGNAGNGSDSGLAGDVESIQSPGTAKNVITVGALEQARNITNETKIPIPGTTNFTYLRPWQEMTDTDKQVAAFSSRGNVGVSVEGEFGRFKPDVVAPGVFVVSTRSQQWDTNAYYNPTNYSFYFYPLTSVDTNTLNNYSIFVPANAVEVIVQVQALNTNLAMPIYINQSDIPSTNNFAGFDRVSLPLGTNGAATSWFYSIGNPTNYEVPYLLTEIVVTTNDNGNYFEVLQGLNDSIGTPGPNGQGYYRFETGTSMAAADVSGVLALMLDFFTNRLVIPYRPTPALLKALLINGAVPFNSIYNYQVQNTINYQGWGLVQLPNSIPASLPTNSILTMSNGPSPMLMYDQSPTNSLATGDQRTLYVRLSDSARSTQMRVTLVWTDPPGNPAAGLKLVNDLDLVVTNLDNTNLVFYGNDFQLGANFTFARDTNAPAGQDVVNNVENVYLSPNLGTNYAITVIGRRVNVNAVTANPNNVAQDYALVISSSSQDPGALVLTNAPVILVSNTLNLTVVTNDFGNNPLISGQLLLNQRVGASSPLIGDTTIALGTGTGWGSNGEITLGVTNQWHFYVVSNASGFSNAAFATFQAYNLAPSRMGVTNVTHPAYATRREADIDLYVSTNANLTNLDQTAVAAADKSLSRGGTEILVYTNSTQGTVYYVGVKSEDQEAAEYIFFGVFSLNPFSSMENGTQVVPGINVPAPIPDGSPAKPGVAQVVGIAVYPMTVRRAVVYDGMTHQNFGDLLGSLTHNQLAVVLNNHTFGNGDLTQTNIYDDNDEGDIQAQNPRDAQGRLILVKHTDGPGNLIEFLGEEGAGLWVLAEADSALTHTGAVNGLTIRLDPQVGDGATNRVTVRSRGWVYFAVDIPPEATNLTVFVENVSPAPGPVALCLRYGALPLYVENSDSFIADYVKYIDPPGGSLSVSTTDLPPLRPGRCYLGLYNPNITPQTLLVSWVLRLSPVPVPPLTFTVGGRKNLLDDAVSYSTITLTNIPDNVTIAQTAVGVVINHPRISDLVLTLISPIGKRILLFENRGGPDTSNLGADITVTNYYGTQVAGGAIADTNVIGPVPTSGTLIIDRDFYSVPDSMDVYYDGVIVFSTGGLIPGNASFSIPYGPGVDNTITIIMNEFGNTNAGTAWIYTPRVESSVISYFTFTDNTNRTRIPIKFFIPPYEGTGGSTNISTFDPPVLAGDYTNGTRVDGWDVMSNQVSVVNDPPNAQSPPQFLALADGVISNNLPVTPGSTYNLSFGVRGPGILGWWRGEGNARDSANGHDGTYPGTSNYVAGMVAQAFDLSGVNPDSVLIPYAADLITPTYTMETWLRPTAQVVDPINQDWIFGQLFGRQLNVRRGTTGVRVYFQFSTGSSIFYGLQSTVDIPIGTYTHVAGTWDGTRLRLYLNGVLNAQSTPGASPADSGCSFFIGGGYNTNAGPCQYVGQFFQGQIDELSYYGRALSASEIQAIYTRGSVGKFDPNPSVPSPLNLAEAQVSLVGIRTDTIFGNNTNWQTWTMAFVPTTNSIPVMVTGIEPGMLLDSFTLTQVPGETFVLPEPTEKGSLKSLIGDDPEGTWTLEARDDRVGAAAGAPEIVSWQLQFILTTNAAGATPLFNGLAVTNTLPACGSNYFYVDVPPWAGYASNILLFATAPVNVWFNQTLPPTSNTNLDNLLISGTGPTTNTLSTGTNIPPLIPGSRYYLMVENPCTNGVPATYAIQVNFGVQFIELTNMVPYTVTNASLFNLYGYYVFNVPTNAARAQFEINDPNGDMELVVRKGLPPPGPFYFDYFSDNPGLNDELIVVLTNSTPVSLTNGDWYLTAINLSGGAVDYSIMASWWPVTGRPISITSVFVSSTNSFCITWASLTNVHYYVQGVAELSDPNWTTLSPTITATSELTTWCVDLPSPYHFFRVVEGLAVTVPALPGGITVTNTIAPCQKAYFAVTVPASAGFALNQLVNATAPVNVWFNQTNTPTGSRPGDFEMITNAIAGSFLLTTNSTPPLVPGATYYLTIENPCANGTNVTVAVRVDFGNNPIVRLTNLVPYPAVNSGGTNVNDYYVFNIPTNAARAQFEIDYPSGDMTLAVRQGALADLINFDYLSATPGAATELIVLFTNSAPVPLTPGDWYLTAVNVSGAPVTYSIMASWWATTGQPIAPAGMQITSVGTNLFLCITWTSLPGVHYYLEGVTSLSNPHWTVVAQDIIGTGATTTQCIPYPSPYPFLQIQEGLAPVTPASALGVAQLGGGFSLQWSGPINARYQVQWTPSLSAAVWNTFTNVVTSTSGSFSFLDDGSQTGGLGGTRFYRVVPLP
jgi:subtilisin-like proprotein convertase family protein